jgi:hypothetical protein
MEPPPSSSAQGSRQISRLAKILQTGAAGSLREMVITLGEIHYQACGNLLHSVQTGAPAFNKKFGMSLFDYLQHNAEAAVAFNQGMTNLSSMLAYPILMAYNFAGISSVVDVGGGEGRLMRKILELNPEMRGTVFDLPTTIGTVHHEPNGDTCGGRCEYVAGDFFTSVPAGSDAYLLCNVIHDWDDARAIAILRNCRKAMAQDGRLLLIEMVVPDSNTPSFSKLLDLNMLVMAGGRERTKAEFNALLDAADYKLTRVVPTISAHRILEAVPRQHRRA